MVLADPYLHAVRAAVALALAEDLTPLGDLTSALLPTARRAVADFVPRRTACWPARCAPPRRSRSSTRPSSCRGRPADGDAVARRRGHRHRVSGPMASILTGERTALNFLCHLSGIATHHQAVRRRGRVGRVGADLGHPEDHAGPAHAAEGGRAGRRRREPPRQPVRLGDVQGQPPRRARHRRGGRLGARPPGRGASCTSRPPTSPSWRRPSRRAPTRSCSTT